MSLSCGNNVPTQCANGIYSGTLIAPSIKPSLIEFLESINYTPFNVYTSSGDNFVFDFYNIEFKSDVMDVLFKPAL